MAFIQLVEYRTSKPDEVAEPGALACLPGLSDRFELPPNHAEGARRAAGWGLDMRKS